MEIVAYRKIFIARNSQNWSSISNNLGIGITYVISWPITPLPFYPYAQLLYLHILGIYLIIAAWRLTHDTCKVFICTQNLWFVLRTTQWYKSVINSYKSVIKKTYRRFVAAGTGLILSWIKLSYPFGWWYYIVLLLRLNSAVPLSHWALLS